MSPSTDTMKRSNLIFTHGAVFAVGVAVAMVANRDDASEAALAESDAASSRAARSDSGGLGDSPGNPDRREAAGPGDRGSSASGSPEGRLEQIVLIADSYERQRALMNLIDQLGPDEFAGVADRFRELDHLGGSGDEYELLLRGWAKADPLKALEYVDLHPDSQRGRNTILESWAGQDAAAAESWALARHDGEGANPHLAAVISGIAAHDIDHATRLVQTMPGSRERGRAIDAMARALMVQGMDAALAYPETIKDPELRGSFVAEITDRLVEKDVNRAADWLASMDDGNVQNRAADEVAEALARQDVQKAADWVTTLKPEARAEAAREVIPVMSQNDIEGTARWVSSLAGTPDYDRAVEAFIWSCDSRAPEQSAAWIQGISDPDRQRRTYHRMLGNWANRDAAAVRQWVATNDVPADIQRRFSR